MESNPVKQVRDCSFCGKLENEVAGMITKPRVFICSECVHGFNELLKKPEYGETTKLFEECSLCSFMQAEELSSMREHNEFKKGTRLVRRTTFCICDECLDFCAGIIANPDDPKFGGRSNET